VLEEKEGWVKVETKISGWVSKAFLKFEWGWGGLSIWKKNSILLVRMDGFLICTWAIRDEWYYRYSHARRVSEMDL